MKFDVESFYNLMVKTLKDNIDTKIDEINAEKADSITLQKPRDPQDYYANFNNQMLAQTFFIYYTMISAKPLENVGGHGSVEVVMHIYAAFVDVDGDNALQKGMRYTRALSEIFKENYDLSPHISDIEVFEHLPQSAQFEKRSKWYKIGGIEIKGIIQL